MTPPLTADERALVGMLAQGLSAAAIGRRIFISERRAQERVQALMARFGARNATQLVAAVLTPETTPAVAGPAISEPADLIAARRAALLGDLDRHQAERGTPYRPAGRPLTGPARRRRPLPAQAYDATRRAA